VGADHKGPLAAFVVVAIIAAVLLVTSVRSQAEPGWQDLRRLVAGPAAPAVMPHGVQQPAAPPATAPSAPRSTADGSSSLAATQDTPSTPSTSSTRSPAGNASHDARTPRHTGRATIIANPSLADQPASDPSAAPDSPGSSDPTLAAQHGLGPAGMLGPDGMLGSRHGDFTWKPQPWWPVAWHHWLSAGGAGHPWGRVSGSRQHHRSH
jgi:hypothetical protein